MNQATFHIDDNSNAVAIELFGEVLIKEAFTEEQQHVAEQLLGDTCTLEVVL